MNMDFSILIGLACIFTFCLAALIILTLIVFHRIYGGWHDEKLLAQTRMNIGEVFTTIDFIVHIESRLYEQYFETNTNVDFTTLSNNEFTNIYNDLSMRCLKAVSPAMWEMSEQYMIREEVQTYITQSVMQFLLSRTTVEPDEEESES